MESFVFRLPLTGLRILLHSSVVVVVEFLLQMCADIKFSGAFSVFFIISLAFISGVFVVD
jgi:hypothetical protein